MYHWYVLQVLAGQEKKVKKSLDEQREMKGMGESISEVLLPIERVFEVKKGIQKIVEKRLWPGYLLVKMDLNDDSWSYVKNTQGVIDFLGGERPNPLTDREVDEILTDLQRKQDVVSQKHKFEVGDSVKIVDGVFINFVGTITDVNQDKGRLNVRVSIFGRDTQVDDLDFAQVEEYAGDEG